MIIALLYRIRLLPLVLISVVLFHIPARAIETIANGDAPQTLVIGVPLTLALPQKTRDVVVGDPALVDAMITSGRTLVLTGKSQGLTSVTLHDPDGGVLRIIPVRVEVNLAELNDIISTDLGLDQVRIRAAKQALIISGQVASTADADKVNETIRAYFGLNVGQDKDVSALRLVNTLKITDREQVMLRVTLSEVQRSLLKQLGIDTQGTWSLGDLTLVNSVSFPTSRTSTTNFTPGVAANEGSQTATLKALERSGYLKTLTEPTLTAISGESAKFNAGGEIPVPTGNICSTNALGVQSCQTSYSYKPVGVSLAFTPMVLSGGRISLHIITDVTEVDPDNGSRTSTGNILAFRSRKMETTVELASGATLMSAGLIQNQTSTTYDRVPGLASIPVLGQLFQSNDYQNQQTELLISVVPYIARPLGPERVDRDENAFVAPSHPTAALIEKINALYGLKAGSNTAKIGFEVP